jgi:predicted SpoU family rRNA methylase
VTNRDGGDHGYTEICARLSARFGTEFRLERTGECTTMVAKFEGGIEVMITDCGESLSRVEAHLDGRAAGYYVGVHRAVSHGVDADDVEQLGYACDVAAPPSAEAIGELVNQALACARLLGEAT